MRHWREAAAAALCLAPCGRPRRRRRTAAGRPPGPARSRAPTRSATPRPARPELRLSRSGGGRPRPDPAAGAAPGRVGPRGPPADLERLRHPAADPRRRPCRAAARRRRPGAGDEPAGAVFRARPGHGPARGRGLVRPGRPALRGRPDAALLAGRKLAVSLHVVGASGPMTWHAKALQTSYATRRRGWARRRRGRGRLPVLHRLVVLPRCRRHGGERADPVVVAFGDSITDGTASTMNGDDRWPDVLSRRLHAKAGNRVAVVNAGIGGNQVVGPAEYGPKSPSGRALGAGAARPRRDRPVGRRQRDLARGHQRFQPQRRGRVGGGQAGMREGVARLRAGIRACG